MNALNILSGKSPPSPPRSRTSSSANIYAAQDATIKQEDPGSDVDTSLLKNLKRKLGNIQDSGSDVLPDEKTPLLQSQTVQSFEPSETTRPWRLIPKRIADAVMTSIKVVITTIAAPVYYVVACFYDESGHFSAILPIRRIHHLTSRKKRRKTSWAAGNGRDEAPQNESVAEKPRVRPKTEEGEKWSEMGSIDESTDKLMSEDPLAAVRQHSEDDDSPAFNTRSKAVPQDEIAPAKRSIRIKLHNEAAQKRRHRSQKSVDGSNGEEDQVAAMANSLKSPSSPTSVTKLKYPRVPAPPRPLVPRRQPSYSTSFSQDVPKKTLVIDLDETLIHSMAKGGRMSTGHMVEVKLQGPIGGNGVALGPQVPILYYVHERPHCHEFLRKVSKWYNLIAFTASVQEYADPVVDWLERERAYFSGRYYRQHCTFRNGAYIKDLSQVEPDLSKVMILDNSPMSYIFHEDNAIPIEGWISDPTDNDLLHLVPFLEGLQYATDVRAILALRLGQTERA